MAIIVEKTETAEDDLTVTQVSAPTFFIGPFKTSQNKKELVCFKVLVKLRSRPQVGVLLDIRMGSNVDQNPLATGY